MARNIGVYAGPRAGGNPNEFVYFYSQQQQQHRRHMQSEARVVVGDGDGGRRVLLRVWRVKRWLPKGKAGVRPR